MEKLLGTIQSRKGGCDMQQAHTLEGDSKQKAESVAGEGRYREESLMRFPREK